MADALEISHDESRLINDVSPEQRYLYRESPLLKYSVKEDSIRDMTTPGGFAGVCMSPTGLA